MKIIPALFVSLLFALFVTVCVSGQPANIQQDGDLLLLASRNDSEEDEWEVEGEEEDAFGNIMHAYFPAFDKTAGEFIDTPQGAALKFTLSVSFPKDQKPEETNNIEEAVVYVMNEYSPFWMHVPLKRIGITKNTETWTADLNLNEFRLTSETRVVYFFWAKDHFGRVITELPETDPGWPPNPNAFFPGAVDINNSEDIVPAELDILDTFIARDHEYIYLASRYEGDINPGTVDPPSANGYISKFTNPAVHEHEGLMAGLMQAFVPLIVYPHDLIDSKAIQSGNSSDLNDLFSYQSRFDDDGREYVIGIGQNTLYSRTNLNAICVNGCDSLRIFFFTILSIAIDTLMPIPINCTPFTIVYLRAHSLNINGDLPFVFGDSEAAALPPTVILFPDNVGATMNNEEILRRKTEFEIFTGMEIRRQGPDNNRMYLE